jgi:hypothetical protein
MEIESELSEYELSDFDPNNLPDWYKECKVCNTGLCSIIDKSRETGLGLNKICRELSIEIGGAEKADHLKQRYLYHTRFRGKKAGRNSTDTDTENTDKMIAESEERDELEDKTEHFHKQIDWLIRKLKPAGMALKSFPDEMMKMDFDDEKNFADFDEYLDLKDEINSLSVGMFDLIRYFGLEFPGKIRRLDEAETEQDTEPELEADTEPELEAETEQEAA